MYLLEIDRLHNRIHITLSGRFDAPQSKALLREMQSRSEELQADAHLLCDLTALTEFDPKARPYFRNLMDLCNATGIRKIVRVIPDPSDNFGLTLMSYFHYDASVAVITCSSFSEALKHLK